MDLGALIQGKFSFSNSVNLEIVDEEFLAQATDFKRGNISHLLIGATPIKKYLQTADQEWVLALKDLIMETDLSPFYKAYHQAGRKAIHPGLIVGLIVYGLLKGIKSLRALEQLSKLDIGSWWLTDGLQPDHSTIGKFIQLHAQVLQDDYFTALTRVILQKLKVNTQEVACDGTIVEAVGSRYKELQKDAILEALKHATTIKEAKMLSQALDICEERNVKQRKKNGRKTDVKVCITDTDAMHQRGKIVGSRSSYKPSVLATKDRIITGISVHPSSENAIIPDLLKHHKTITGNMPSTLLGDAGYCTLDNIALCEESHITFLSPSGKEGKQKKGTMNDFHKSKFTYDASNDVMVCPAGYTLTVDTRGKNRHGKYFTQYRCNNLADCPYAKQCTRSQKTRTVKRYVGDDAKTRHLANMELKSSKKQFSKRKAMVEPVFSELKGFFNLKRFTRYGLKGASVEMALFGIAYNFKRYLKLKKAPPADTKVFSMAVNRPQVNVKVSSIAANRPKFVGLTTIWLNYMFLQLKFSVKAIFTRDYYQISFFSVI
ncbi:MAG: transposase [Caldisericia bacterium]|nr:transposase [Caldisericia bacterium]